MAALNWKILTAFEAVGGLEDGTAPRTVPVEDERTVGVGGVVSDPDLDVAGLDASR